MITRDQIEAKRTPNGGFTRQTLAEWGVSWPPPKGWMRALIRGAEEPDFLQTQEWRELRYAIMERDGFRCVICGRDAGDGVKLQVDHVKPRSLYPELEKDPNWMRTLCEDCNQGRGQRAA